MRLQYNILWFENDEDWIDSVVEDIQEFLLNNAFILNYDNQKNASNLDTIIAEIKDNTRDVDIILMDYQLLKHDKGDQLIKRIREKDVFTEILFYSQKEAVREKFKDECIEGIYFSNRSDFTHRLLQIVPHTIKKVLDLTNMRGLVMAETSLLDLQLNELLINMFLYLDKNDRCRRQEIVDKVFQKRLEHADRIKDIEHTVIKKKKNFLLNVSNKDEYIKDISYLLESIESSDRYQAVNKLAKIITGLLEWDKKLLNIFKGYDQEIIKMRNILAHVKEEVIEGKIVLKSKFKGYESFTFSHQEFEEIRRSLIVHTKNIEDMNLEICKYI